MAIMDNNTYLTIAEKLRIIREHKEITQPSFADALGGCAVSKISETESGKKQYTDEEVEKLKKLLGIEDAPLTDEKIEKFRSKLFVWRDYTREWEAEKSQESKESLAIIQQ